jgi:hypothetical protein
MGKKPEGSHLLRQGGGVASRTGIPRHCQPLSDRPIKEIMRKCNVIQIVAGLAFSCVAVAEQNMPRDVYTADKDRIEREYKVDKARCDSLTDNAKDICLAEAKGKEEVAEADLEARYKPSREARYKVSAAKAEADYRVAKERCDDKSGNPKDICVEEAKAAQATAKADAKRRE